MSVKQAVRTEALETCIEAFKEGYKPRAIMVKDENSVLLSES